jgi:MSHA pilin protein MshD
VRRGSSVSRELGRDARAIRSSVSSSTSNSGMSLIELVVAIVVVAICFALVDTTTRRSVDPMLERQATSIAEAYLEEIAQQAYRDPDDGTICPGPEAERALFDNVCDYQGLVETGARDQTGALVSGLESYHVSVSIDSNATLGEADVLRIDVTVTDPMGRPVRLSLYRTNA